MTHILLVEPNTVLASVYRQALRQADYSVAHAVGAQAAVDTADEQCPDLVILELQLPGHSGIEFLHEFRSYPEWQAVPVVVLTMLTPDRLVPAKEPLARDLGVHTLLYKPCTTLPDLLRVVRQELPAGVS